MKVALTVWNERIAPVFDVARTVHLLEDERSDGLGIEEFTLPDAPLERRIRSLLDHGVDTLVCGAISRPVERLVRSYGITVIPFVSGRLSQVVEAWRRGELNEESFAMPGCRRRRQRRRRRCAKQGLGEPPNSIREI